MYLAVNGTVPPRNAGKSGLISIISMRKSPWGRSRTARERKPQTSVRRCSACTAFIPMALKCRMNLGLRATHCYIEPDAPYTLPLPIAMYHCLLDGILRSIHRTGANDYSLQSGHVSTHCGQLGLIHHFLYAQPTPVDIYHRTKFLVPLIYPFLI